MTDDASVFAVTYVFLVEATDDRAARKKMENILFPINEGELVAPPKEVRIEMDEIETRQLRRERGLPEESGGGYGVR